MRWDGRRMFSCIFFDLDGTLADSISASYCAHVSFLAGFGIVADPADFEEVNGPSIPEVIAILRKKFGLQEDAHYLCESYRAELVQACGNVQPFAGAAEVLAELKARQYKILLVTSSDAASATSFLERHSLLAYFDECVFGTEVTRAKPDPEIYRLALHKASVAPDAAVAVEDSFHGVAAARAAGLFAVGIDHHQSPARLLAAGANATVSQLSDVLALVHG